MAGDVAEERSGVVTGVVKRDKFLRVGAIPPAFLSWQFFRWCFYTKRTAPTEGRVPRFVRRQILMKKILRALLLHLGWQAWALIRQWVSMPGGCLKTLSILSLLLKIKFFEDDYEGGSRSELFASYASRIWFLPTKPWISFLRIYNLFSSTPRHLLKQDRCGENKFLAKTRTLHDPV